MTEPWFNPNAYGWIPGVFVGVAGGIEGTLAGVCVWRGKCRTLVMAVCYTDLLISCLLLAAGIVALATGQPYGVWYGLGFPGLLSLIILGPFTWSIPKWYTAAELHKSMGEDL